MLTLIEKFTIIFIRNKYLVLVISPQIITDKCVSNRHNVITANDVIVNSLVTVVTASGLDLKAINTAITDSFRF